jgi:hypothetical protein
MFTTMIKIKYYAIFTHSVLMYSIQYNKQPLLPYVALASLSF